MFFSIRSFKPGGSQKFHVHFLRLLMVLALSASVLVQSPVVIVRAAPLMAVISVNTFADEAGAIGTGCSLREAITAANTNGTFGGCTAGSAGADVITLAAGTFTLSIPNAAGVNEDFNATGDLDINESLTIQGAGSASTIIQAGTTSANGIDKVIAANPFCTAGVNVTIDGVTVRNGQNTQPANAPDFSQTGAGIDWCAGGNSDTFTLSNAIISDNTNLHGYGGGLNLDSLSVNSTANITNVTFQNNTIANDASTNQGTGAGINIFTNQSTVTITNSTFSGNHALRTNSGGGALAYRPTISSALNITGSTFNNNSAQGSGGAIYSTGLTAGTTLSLQNSQFTNNTATISYGGALYLSNLPLNTTPYSLNNLLFTGNHAGLAGGGLYIGPANLVLTNSRIIGNTAALGSGIYKSVDTAVNVSVANNWWGCSTGPSALPCDVAATAGGPLTFAPWFRADLQPDSALVINQSSALSTSFLTNSSNAGVSPASLGQLIGQPVTWAATLGSLSAQQATIQAAGTATATFTATGIGSAVISARVDNDNTSGVSSNVLNLTISKANTTTAVVTHTPNPSVVGQSVAVGVTVTGAFGNTPVAPTGTVAVTSGTDTCTITLPASSCNLGFSTAGSKSISAVYNGDANFNGSPVSSTVSHTVNQADTTTTITSDLPDPSVVGQTITVNFTVAVVSPGAVLAPTALTQNVTVSDGSNSCFGTLTSGSGSCTLTFTTAGPYNLTATYDGDVNFKTSTSSSVAHTVNQADTTTTITYDTPDPSLSGGLVTFGFTVAPVAPGAGTPSGNVTVSDGAANTCTALVTAGSCDITFSTVGTFNLTATYAGNANFKTSTSSFVVHTVTQPTTVVSLNRLSANPTKNATVTWQVVFADAVDNLSQTNFTLVNTGLAGTPAITTVVAASGPPSTTWNITASTGSGDGTLGLNLTNDTGLTPNVTNLPFTGQLFTLDRTNPNPPLLTTPANGSLTTDSTPAVGGTAEANSTVNVYFDGSLSGSIGADNAGFWSYTPGSALSDGSHTVKATATDAAGNTGSDSNINTFTVDSTAPDTSITANPANPTNNSTANFSFTGNDGSGSGISGFECALDGGAYAACTSPKNYPSLPDGSHTFAVRAIDAAGNVDATPASFTWMVDTVSPSMLLTSLTPGSTNSSPFSVTVTFSEPVSGFTPTVASGDLVIVNGTASNPAGSGAVYTFDLTPTSLGLITVDIPSGIAQDAANNLNTAAPQFSRIYDSSTPDTTITSNPASMSSLTSASFAFVGVDNGSSGIASFECDLDGSGFSACTSPQNYSALSQGSHSFLVRAINGLGSLDASPALYTWIIDTTAPDTSLTANPAVLTTSVSASFSFTGSDTGGSGLAGFECKLDGGSFAACVSPNNYSSLADGSHTFQVRAVDGAGSRDASPASFTWVVDTTAPTNAITASPANPTGSTSANFGFSAADTGGSGIASIECSLDGTAYAACTSPLNYSGLSFGPHTFDVRSIDLAGNLDATPASYYWVIVGTFGDVSVSYWAAPLIERIYFAGITGGCSASPLSYCPERPVTRAEMAVLIMHAINGLSYTPPALPPAGTGFTDVPATHWAAAWIQAVADAHIMIGYSDAAFHPEAQLTRAEMALVLLRATNPYPYAPPVLPFTGSGFSDVPPTYWAAAWIAELKARGLTAGYADGTFRPDNFNTRAEVAVFLVHAFNLK